MNYPAWGRYLLRACDQGGHCGGRVVYIDWPGWAGRPQTDQGGGAAMLQFSADKESYKVGETVTLSIPTGPEGRALVSLESGARVLRTAWLDTLKGMTLHRFPVTEEMAPNIYAHVTLLQKHEQTQNDLPIRMYGAIPILVENPATRLEPELEMPDVIRPEEELHIRVSEKNGRAMSYTVALVDDGLLDLTRFRTPDPHSLFYSRQALGVRTFDVYDQVLGAYGARLEALLGIGGGDDMGGPTSAKMNRFRPVVEFLGPFRLEKRKTALHKIQMPPYIGSVRTMVVAGDSGAYGSTEKTTPVKKPLMALASLPRLIGPGEDLLLPVTVFALEEEVRNVDLTLEAGDLFQNTSGGSKRLKFTSPGDQVVFFPLRTKERTGTTNVKITAKSGSHTAHYNVDIVVRNPNPPVTAFLSGEVPPGETRDIPYEGPGLPGSNSGTAELSVLPPLSLGRHLDALVGYPHGCIEQTTSRAFPQLYLPNLMELDKERKSEIEFHIRRAIDRIASFQRGDGGLSFWPGGGEADEWGTNYAGHFVLEAKRLGYSPPDEFLDAIEPKVDRLLAAGPSSRKNAPRPGADAGGPRKRPRPTASTSCPSQATPPRAP